MMYGAWGWGWTEIAVTVLLLLILSLLILQTVRLFSQRPADSVDSTGSRGPAPGSARRIAEERLARGEISPEDFAQIVRALERSI